MICVLEDGATKAEKKLVAARQADLIRVQRDALRRAIAPHVIAPVERPTFLSGTDDTGGSSVEAVVLEPEPPPAPAELDPHRDAHTRKAA